MLMNDAHDDNSSSKNVYLARPNHINETDYRHEVNGV